VRHLRLARSIVVEAGIAVRFDNFVKYDCKIKEGAVGPGVAVEPVSTPKFPANREKNREFFDLRSDSQLRWFPSPMISVALS
jgi:hypothetical protein